jgi:hypothetical protein
MNVVSTSLPKRLQILSSSEFKVHNKLTFRAWCHHFGLGIEHVSHLFGVSHPQVYKYIDMSLSTNIRKPVINACNLISMKGQDGAESYLQELFEKAEMSWPSSSPIEH